MKEKENQGCIWGKKGILLSRLLFQAKQLPPIITIDIWKYTASMRDLLVVVVFCFFILFFLVQETTIVANKSTERALR